MLKRVLIAAVLGGAVSALGFVALRRPQTLPATGRAAAQREPAGPLGGLSPTTETRYVGVVLPDHSVDVAARAEGRLASVRVRLGDHVQRDAVLASLEVREQEGELGVADAALRAAEAEVERAELELAQARDREKRVQALSGEGAGGTASAVSGDELERTRYQVKIAGARLSSARATVNERRARISQVRAGLHEAAVRAPFDGQITNRFVDPGAMVTRGTPILRLISSALLCRFAVPEADAGRLAEGGAVAVEVDEGAAPTQATAGTRRVRGVIEKVAPEVDAAARMVVVEARLEVGEAQRGVLAGRVARVALLGPPR